MSSPDQRAAKNRALSADLAMFPVATVFALVAIPGWLVVRGASIPMPANWHGHEMIFGYALAVVAGFLVTRTSRGVLLALILTWIAARLAAFVGGSAWAFVAGLSFPATVIAAAAPPLLRGAKRGENKIAPMVLFVLLSLDAIWWSGRMWFGASVQQHVLLAAIDVLGLLMLVVGGRALPAAVGGYLERQGIARADMIRSGYELPLAGIMALAAFSDLVGLPAIAGACSIAAALTTLWRVAFWRLHYTVRHVQLWSLALAYLWLIPAFLIKGIGQLAPVAPVTHLLHAFTIGALGSLTLVMMSRTALLRMRKPLAAFTSVGVAVLLLAASAALRLAAAPSAVNREWWLWLSAGAWMIAFSILLIRLWRAYGTRIT